LVTETASTSGAHRFYSSITPTTSTTYTVSIFVKAGTATCLQIAFNGGGLLFGTAYANFDVSSGALGTSGANVSSPAITNAGNGWYKISVSGTTSSTSTMNVLFYLTDNNSSASGNPSYTSPSTGRYLYAYGAQIEVGSSASSYIQTTGATATRAADIYGLGNATYFGSDGLLKYATINQPRFGYNPSTLQPRGLLVEGTRTNSSLGSTDISVATYMTGNALASRAKTTETAAPDGTNNAIKMVMDTSTDWHRIFGTVNLVPTNANTFSIFIKNAPGNNYPYVRLQISGNGTGGGGQGLARFNLLTQTLTSTLGTGVTGVVTVLNNGWARYEIRVPAGVNTGTTCFVSVTFLATDGGSETIAGDGTSAMYLFGYQLEQGAFASSYIPTTTAAATRSSDFPMISNSASVGYNNTANTIFVQSEIGFDTNSFAIAGDDGAGGFASVSRMHFVNRAGERGVFVQKTNTNVTNISDSTVKTSGVVNKLALSFGASGSIFYQDGVLVGTGGTDASGVSIPVFRLGYRNNAGTYQGWLFSHLQKISFYPTALTASQLQQLTQ